MCRHTIIRTSVAALVAGVALSAASCNHPREPEMTAQRIGRMQHCLALAKEREEQAPKNLAATLRLSRDVAQDRHVRFVRNDERLRRRFAWEIERWYQRQSWYEAAAEDWLGGDLDNAYDTFPKLFY
jgi:hypothetical protein